MSLSVEDVKTALGDQIVNLLIFDDEGEYIIAKVKKFLPGNEFAKVAAKARETFNGEYMKGLGANSHFRWAKQRKPKAEADIDIVPLLLEVERDLEKSRQAIRRALDLIKKAKT
jgi:hypothetical protein